MLWRNRTQLYQDTLLHLFAGLAIADMCLLIFVCLVRAIGRLGKDAIICFATLPGRELRRIVIDEPCNYRKQEAHRYSAHQHADDALDWRKRAPVRWKSDVATAEGRITACCRLPSPTTVSNANDKRKPKAESPDHGAQLLLL